MPVNRCTIRASSRPSRWLPQRVRAPSWSACPQPWLPERLEALLDAGLDRLTVSLHTLDPARWREIYGFSGIDALRARLDQIVAHRQRSGRPFVLDFVFVAMRRNLDQLPAIANLADRCGAPVLAIHPLIERDPLRLGKASERTGDDQLEASFAERLRMEIESVRDRHPGLVVEVSTPELCASDALGPDPRRWPGETPAGARLRDCDQSPLDSVHILSDGRVVSCEQREKIVMGEYAHSSRSTLPFDLRCTLPAKGSGVFEFEVDAAWIPHRAGVSADTRELGFALESAAAE